MLAAAADVVVDANADASADDDTALRRRVSMRARPTVSYAVDAIDDDDDADNADGTGTTKKRRKASVKRPSKNVTRKATEQRVALESEEQRVAPQSEQLQSEQRDAPVTQRAASVVQSALPRKPFSFDQWKKTDAAAAADAANRSEQRR